MEDKQAVPKKKRKYSPPEITVVKIDNKISLVMMSTGGDPEEPSAPENFVFNPFKIFKL